MYFKHEVRGNVVPRMAQQSREVLLLRVQTNQRWKDFPRIKKENQADPVEGNRVLFQKEE